MLAFITHGAMTEQSGAEGEHEQQINERKHDRLLTTTGTTWIKQRGVLSRSCPLFEVHPAAAGRAAASFE
jgi:hypothetical protein